jgi:aminoglycoside phosphotransferase (APT) family kinase protein
MPWVDEGHYPGEIDRLETLPLALDPAHMRPVLAAHAPAALGPNLVIDTLDVDVYRRHGNRCVLRYRARGTSATGAVEWRVIGKVLPPGMGVALDANMRALWAHGFARGAADGIGIPEPIAYLPELSMHLQEDVGGTSVRNLVRRGAELGQFRIAARALAKLHRCEFGPGPGRGVEDLLLRCHPRHPFLGLAVPELAASVDDLVEHARALERRLAPLPITPVHGDFHLGQVHVDGDRAWLVDLDALGFGDPASDLGNVVVFLDDKIRRDPAMAALVAAFRDEYAAHAADAAWERMPLYEALTHLRRACKQVRLQQPGWRDKVRAMMERAQQKLAGAESLALAAGERKLAQVNEGAA